MQSYAKGDASITYSYDENGLRTKKVVNGVEYQYYYVGDRLVYEQKGDEYAIYYRYDNDGRLSFVNKVDVQTGDKLYYSVITNSFGDVTEIRNGAGELKGKYIYDAWGKLISITDANGNAVSASNIASLVSIRYRGYVYDTETGLYYLQSRYYDPEVGRFINADDLGYIGATGSLISYNAFSYCENNPINKFDPHGTDMLSVITNVVKIVKIMNMLVKPIVIAFTGIKLARPYCNIVGMPIKIYCRANDVGITSTRVYATRNYIVWSDMAKMINKRLAPIRVSTTYAEKTKILKAILNILGAKFFKDYILKYLVKRGTFSGLIAGMTLAYVE